MTDCFIQSSASKRAKSLQTHQSRLLILYLNITSSSSFPPYFLKSVHYIPSPFSSAKSLFYCADAKRNAKQSCIPTVGLCHQSREKFTRIIYCQLCSAHSDTHRHPTVQEGTEMQSSSSQQICIGVVGGEQNGNPGI